MDFFLMARVVIKKIMKLFSNDVQHVETTHINKTPVLIYSKRHSRTIG